MHNNHKNNSWHAQIRIRKYNAKDQKQVQFIHWETGFIGKSMSKIYTRRKNWAKKTNYYLLKEPESCFVAENTKNKKVVGYLFGCLDDKKHNEKKEFISELIFQIVTYIFTNKKNKKFARNLLGFTYDVVLGKNKILEVPKNSGHIHINILPEARAKGIGSKLLKTFFEYAKTKGVKKIHADSFQTPLNPNKNFWIKNGFKEFAKAPTTYWKKYYPDEKIDLCYYVKTI